MDRDVRRAVVEAGHTGDIATIRPQLSATDPQLRALALSALARAAGLGTGDLAAALADSDPVVRRRAAELTAALPGDGPPSLVDALVDPDETVVEMAAWASGERTPAEPGVVPILVGLVTGHEDALCREAAVAALGSLGDPDGRSAVVAATGDKPAVRRRAVLALAAFEGPDVDAALERARGDRDWQVRQAVEDVAD